MKKPIAIIIHTRASDAPGMDQENEDRAALVYLLRTEYGCETMVYEGSCNLRDDVSRVRSLGCSGLIALAIVKQQVYSDGWREAIAVLRENVPPPLPLVVIRNERAEEMLAVDEGGVAAFVGFQYETNLAGYIRNALTAWKPPINWLGAETPVDQETLLRQLVQVQRAHEPESERWGTPDDNHLAVAEALRIHMLPASVLKEEFDDALPSDARAFVPMEPTEYEREVGQIRNMDYGQRRNLLDDIWYSLLGRGASLGSHINGFAIDPVTLESLVTDRFGDHRLAHFFLAKRIQRIEALRRNMHHLDLSMEIEDGCSGRIIDGFVFNGIGGYSTPILRLDGNNRKDLARVARHIMDGRKFIPIDCEGRLLVP